MKPLMRAMPTQACGELWWGSAPSFPFSLTFSLSVWSPKMCSLPPSPDSAGSTSGGESDCGVSLRIITVLTAGCCQRALKASFPLPVTILTSLLLEYVCDTAAEL